MMCLSWESCLLLGSLQKLPPLLLLTNITSPSGLPLPLLAAWGASVGALGGLNQTQLRALLAYSSIGHAS